MRTIASTLRATSSSVVDQPDTLMRMAARPCHSVPTAPARSLLLYFRDHSSGCGRIPERDHHLVQDDLIQHGIACLSQTLGELRREPAIPLDQRGEPFAPERSQRCPDLDTACAARRLRRVMAGSRASVVSR